MTTEMKPVGFWNDPDDRATDHLPHPEEFVDVDWDIHERKRVIDYLKRGRTHINCAGFSWCRFRCGVEDRQMGSRMLTDGTYVWPQGYVHYLEMHHVKPPEEFLQHVRAKLREQTALDPDDK